LIERVLKKKGNIFDKGDDSASDTSEESALAPDEELELYLSTRPDKDVADPIRWWKEKQTVYPRLSQMAIDFLTIPGEHVAQISKFSWLNPLQAPLSTSNACSAVPALSTHNHDASSLSYHHGPSSVLVHGACLYGLRIWTRLNSTSILGQIHRTQLG
jgi:hAT family C-terminal dimerisation region